MICLPNFVLKKHFFLKLGTLWGNGEIWVPYLQGRIWTTDGQCGIAWYLKTSRGGRQEMGKQNWPGVGKVSMWNFSISTFSLTPNGYSWPVCCQILIQHMWLITAFKFRPSSGSAQRCHDVSFGMIPNTILLSFDSIPFHMGPLLPPIQPRMVTSWIALGELG